MKATERNALLKIIDARFEILASEIIQREEDIGEMIRKRLVEESKTAGQEAQKRVDGFVQRARALQNEFDEEVKAIHDELGVVPGHTSIHTERVYDDDEVDAARRQRRNPRTRIRNYALQTGRDIVRVYISDHPDWTTPNVEQRTKEELRKLGLDAKKAQRKLEKERLDLHEKILLGVLESMDAKAFLENVPKIEDIMPAPQAELGASS